MLAKPTPFPLIPEDSNEFTTSDLLYYTPPVDGSKPYDRLYDGISPSTNEALPKRNFISKIYNKKIYDLRSLLNEGREGETNVDITGFQLIGSKDGRTEMKDEDWEDDRVIREVYYREVEELLKKTTPAKKVVIFDHTIRRVERKGEETEDLPESRKPVARVHIDQTPASGLARVRRHITNEEESEELLRGRAQLINLWRPIKHNVTDSPLAVCDARTLKDSRDLVPSRLLYQPPMKEGETFQVAHSPEHKWYYLSNMTPHEALLLKCWDNQDLNPNLTEEEKGAKTPHSGIVDDRFKDLYVEKTRQSIEVRCLIFY